MCLCCNARRILLCDKHTAKPQVQPGLRPLVNVTLVLAGQLSTLLALIFFFFFQAEDGIRDADVTGVQTCALPIWVPTDTSPASIPTTSMDSMSLGLMPVRYPLGPGSIATPSRIYKGVLPLLMEIGRASCRERV